MGLEVDAEIRVLGVVAKVIFLQHGIVEAPRQTALLHMLHLQPYLVMMHCDRLKTFGPACPCLVLPCESNQSSIGQPKL